MVSKKISILVLLVLSTIYNSESRGTYSSSKDFNQHPNNNQDCFCPASSGPYNVKVPEIIQPRRGLERLVIYLYRDMDTYQIKMHTPSKKVQKLIPDLPFEYGDELVVVSGETMQMVFDKSSEKIIKEESGNVLKNIEAKPMHNIYMDMPSNEEEDNRMAVNEEPDKSYMYRPNFFSQAFPSYNKFNNIPDGPSDKFSEYKQNGNNIHRYPQKFVPHVVPSNYDVNTFYNQRVKDDITYKKNTVPSNHDMHKFYEPMNHNNIPSFSKDDGHHVIPSESVAGFRSIDPNAIPHKQNGGQFGEWIVKQMKTFNDDHKIEGHQIDSNAVGNFILQILHKNGMHVTDKGVIADSQGRIVNIHNLSLIPILIGETTPHDKFLQRDAGPQALPYLQAILVATSQPLKILGIIPLGKTFLPKSTLGNISKIWKTILPKSMDKKTSLMHKPNLQNISGVDKSGSDNENSDSTENFDNYGLYNYPEYNINKHISRNNINHNHHKRKSSESQFYEHHYDTEDGNRIPLNYFSLNDNEIEDLSAKDNSNAERMFWPDITLHDEPLQMFSRDQDTSFNFIPHTQSPKIHVHSMLPDYGDWSFRSQSMPLDGLSDTHSYFAPSYTPYIKGISSVLGKYSDPLKTLKKLSVMDMSSDRENMPFSVMPNPMSSSGMVPVPTPFRSGKYFGKYGVSSFNTLPLPAGISLNTPLGFPLHLESGSRSGNEIPVPDIADMEDSVKNGEEVFDFLVAGDDDGDDGDFRIIGGNAATGSGTPLSNKGRSGFIY